MKLNAGNLGRGYLVTLWLGVTGLMVVAFGKWTFEHWGASFDRVEWNSNASILVVALLHGATALGVIRRQRWSYYLSLALSMYWVIDSAYDLVTPPLTRAPRWFPATFFIPGAVALVWLVTPALRSQFSGAIRKA